MLPACNIHKASKRTNLHGDEFQLGMEFSYPILNQQSQQVETSDQVLRLRPCNDVPTVEASKTSV